MANCFWFYSILAGWSTWQWVFMNFSQNFWSFDNPYTPGCSSAVYAESEIWNRFKQFLPVWYLTTQIQGLTQLLVIKLRLGVKKNLFGFKKIFFRSDNCGYRSPSWELGLKNHTAQAFFLQSPVNFYIVRHDHVNSTKLFHGTCFRGHLLMLVMKFWNSTAELAAFKNEDWTSLCISQFMHCTVFQLSKEGWTKEFPDLYWTVEHNIIQFYT